VSTCVSQNCVSLIGIVACIILSHLLTNFSYIKQYSNQSGLNGIQLWGTASTSDIEILERFQSKALRMIVDAPWCVPNTVI
jgi:hypothetical protein